MQKVEQEPDRPRPLVWVLVCAIGFVLITGAVLAIWLIVLEEKTNQPWQVAAESAPGSPLMPQAAEESTDDGADEKIADAKKDAAAPAPSHPTPKDDIPSKEAPKKEDVKPANDDTASSPSPKDAPSRPSSKDEIGIGSDGWFEVNCLGGKFQMLVPGVPMYQRFELPRAAQPGDEYQARNSADGLIYRGSSILVRDSEVAEDSAADQLKSSIVRLLPKPAFELKRDKEVNHDGRAGREFVALGLGDMNVAGWLFRVPEPGGQTRVFCFTVSGASATLNATDVKRFFQSVKMHGAGALAKKSEAANPKDNQTPPVPKTADAATKKESEAKRTEEPTPIIPGAKNQPAKAVPALGNSAAGVTGISPVPAKLSAHVGAVIDVQAKAAVLFLPGGLAKLYAYPEFQALGVYKLSAGTAHRPIYDKASGRLFALAASAKAKDPAGKPGGSQVAVYHFRDLLDGKLANNAELAPAKLITLPAHCSQMCVSADGAWIYALEMGKTMRALRISAATGELSGAAELPEFTTSIALAKDGNRLYALAHLTARVPKAPPPHGALIVIHADTMKPQKTVNLPLDPFEMQAAEESIAFISGHGGVRSEILVVDVAKELSLVASWKGMPPSVSLRLSDDERTLFVANWKGTPPAIGAFEIPMALAGSDSPPGQWVSAPSGSARGEMIVTPDNRYLLCDSGAVFYLRGAEPGGKGNPAAPR